MSYSFFVLPNKHELSRHKIFMRIQEEKLTTFCMHSEKNPTLERWLEITDPSKGWLLCCVPKNMELHTVDTLCAIAWITPWRGRIWTFDFTVFRPYFSKAPHMSKAALAWIFTHAPCDNLMGICPISNAHAWRIATQSGFEILGKLHNACFHTKRSTYEDGVLVIASKKNFEKIKRLKTSFD